MDNGDGLDPGAGVEFDSDGGTIQIRHSWSSDEALTEDVVTAVAIATDSEPTDLAPLYESIDPDALNSLYDVGSADEGPQSGGHLTFWWSGCEITVYRSGHTVIAVSDEMLA